MQKRKNFVKLAGSRESMFQDGVADPETIHFVVRAIEEQLKVMKEVERAEKIAFLKDFVLIAKVTNETEMK